MMIQNTQALKRFTYICLSLSSILFLSDAQGEPPSQDLPDRESRRAFHNRMADKYAQGRHRLPPRVSRQAPSLGEHAEQFHHSAILLTQTMQDRDEAINSVGNQGRALVENLIDENVKNTRTKSLLRQFFGGIVNLLTSCF